MVSFVFSKYNLTTHGILAFLCPHIVDAVNIAVRNSDPICRGGSLRPPAFASSFFVCVFIVYFVI